MLWLKIVLSCFALLCVVGGIGGFQAGSNVSLIAGVGLAVVVMAGVGLTGKNERLGYGIAAIGPLAALGRFLPTYLKTGATWPALAMVIGSGIAIVALIAGHFVKRSTLEKGP